MPGHANVEIAQQVLIVNARDRVLLLRRPDGNWQFAGGRLEENEQWDKGLKREVKEETGIDDLEIISVLMVNNWVHERVPLYGIYFCGRTTMEEIALSPEHDHYRWVSREDDLDEIRFWHPSLRLLVERFFQGQHALIIARNR